MTEIEQAVHRILDNLAEIQHELPKLLALAGQHEPKRSYSVREAAEIIGKSDTTVRRLIDRGLLESFVPNGMENGMRVTAESLDAWLSGNG